MSVFSILCHHDSLEHPVITFYKVHKTEVNRTNCYVLLTVHAIIMMVFFFTNLMHKFFILIHLLIPLHVSRIIMLIFRRTNCISAESGIVILFG